MKAIVTNIVEVGFIFFILSSSVRLKLSIENIYIKRPLFNSSRSTLRMKGKEMIAFVEITFSSLQVRIPGDANVEASKGKQDRLVFSVSISLSPLIKRMRILMLTSWR